MAKIVMADKRQAMLLCSGGLDSSVAVASEQRKYHLSALFVDFGQGGIEQEIQCARKICDRYGVPFDILPLNDLFHEEIVGAESYDWFETAGAYALLQGAEVLLTGMHKDDFDEAASTVEQSTTSPEEAQPEYRIPDEHTRLEAREATREMMRATKGRKERQAKRHFFDFARRCPRGKETYQVLHPFEVWSKGQIIQFGHQIGFPFEWTFSCITEQAIHCGECEECLKRKEAFLHSGVPDPTRYSV